MIAVRAMQVVANFIWVSAIRVTVRTVHIPARFVGHNLPDHGRLLSARGDLHKGTCASWRPLKSHRRKSGKRGESSTSGARGSPPRLIADDPVHVDGPILLVGFDSGFGLGPEITIDRPRIGRRS
jgi:hypothetical protein